MILFRTRSALGIAILASLASGPAPFDCASRAAAQAPVGTPQAPTASTTPRQDDGPSQEEIERKQALELALRGTPGGLRLDEVVAKAIAHSARLSRADKDIERADIKQQGAVIAFSPRLDLGARYTRLSHVDMPEFNGRPFPQVLDQYAGTAGLRIPITDWFLTVLPQYRGMARLAEVAKYERAARASEVAYETRLAYFTYLRTQGALTALMESAEVLKSAVADLEALVSAGAATRTDLMRTRAALADAELNVLDAQGRVGVASVRLSRLVGTEIKPGAALGEQLTSGRSSTNSDAGKFLEQALAVRPELEALRKLREAKEQLLAGKRGARYPQLGAVGNFIYANPNLRVFPQEQKFTPSWDAGLLLSWSPNDAVTANTGAKDAELEIEQIQADLRGLEDAVAIEVSDALAAYATAQARTAVATEVMDAARRHYFDQSALLKAGAATTSDVLEAETEMLHAELQWVDAFVQARMADAGLLKAQGRTGLESTATGPVESTR